MLDINCPMSQLYPCGSPNTEILALLRWYKSSTDLIGIFPQVRNLNRVGLNRGRRWLDYPMHCIPRWKYYLRLRSGPLGSASLEPDTLRNLLGDGTITPRICNPLGYRCKGVEDGWVFNVFSLQRIEREAGYRSEIVYPKPRLRAVRMFSYDAGILQARGGNYPKYTAEYNVLLSL